MASVGVGLAGFVIVMGVVMPDLSPTQTHIMIGADLGQLSRDGWPGTSLGEIAGAVFSHPFAIVQFVLLDLGGLFYLALLFLPLALTPLAGIEYLLPGLADLAANLLSANPMPRSIFAYHSVALVPVLVVARMHGARRVSKLKRYSPQGLGRMCLILSKLGTYWVLPLPLPGSANIWDPVDHRLWPEPLLAEVRGILSEGVSISAQANVGSQFAEQAEVRVFPHGLDDVACVVLHLRSPTVRIEGDDPAVVGSMAHHLQMAPADFLSAVRQIVTGEDYGERYRKGPWLVLCRGIEGSESDRGQILQDLDRLRGDWGLDS